MKYNFDQIIDREGTASIKYDKREELFGTNEIIPMWVADMDFPTPSFIVNKLTERALHPVYGYSFRTEEYYKAIIDWQKKRHNWNVRREWISFCPGIVPALNLCTLSFTRPGDGIIIQPPVYFPFFSAAENHGRQLIFNPLQEVKGRWEMDFENLERLAASGAKMLILSNPHNPTGTCWRENELRKLGDICLKNNIIILSDEIHCDLVLPGYKHTPVSKLSTELENITVTCIAPSKTFNLAGLSTASVIIPNDVLRKYFRKKIEDLHIGNGNIFGSVASTAAYSEGAEWVDELTLYVSRNADFAIRYLNENVPEIIAVKPEATYLMWIDCRGLKMNDKDLHRFFIEKAGVGLSEGAIFGPGGSGFMRMNLGAPKTIVERALNQISEAVKSIRNTL
jgi:cysteine-S-conjugate beta-lyase